MSKAKRGPSDRACDRCRKRKARCDFTGSACSRCQLAGIDCTFFMPVGRRGPKTRQSRAEALNAVPLIQEPPVSQLPERNAESVAPSLGTSENIPLPSATWETRVGINPALSSSQVSQQQPVPSPISDTASSRLLSSFQRWDDLAAAVACKIPTLTLERLANKCFDLYFEYLFPLIPLVHEPSLRAGLDFFVTRNLHARRASKTTAELWSPSVQRNAAGSDTSTLDTVGTLEYPESWPESTFTLLTAVCAEAASLLPAEIFPEGDLIADVFLNASRDCLNSYIEADLEHPNANSVTIRYFHSNCLHAAGKPKYSWHIFGEAARLVQVMQLHDESSYEGLFPVEAELRRRAFWIVYMGDKSAAILNNRPITLHKFSFDSRITTPYPSGIVNEPAISPGQVRTDIAQPDFIAGFNANVRLWQAASDLLLEIRILQENRVLGQPLTDEQRGRIDALYVRFMTCLDDLPLHLQIDNFGSANEGRDHSKQAVIQRVNLQVSFHCLRMVITQKFEGPEFLTPTVEQTDLLLLRKTEIARDMLRVIREAPFWALQVNGEPCVSMTQFFCRDLEDALSF
ncbi:C6 transcription factor [Rasamsonia emersonii CBS 393.64]|uniref:C6 transcription factor n=1 Tax=Rasamsonia emersonii (strain ATCC 16479 / CBS 393.64 / IMI 116815) TaxID=1408163 RepID=A0A0F4YF09_RASE3|nr:C6 transcription factor [Rasamsonia emersonii CBS 393.64]KKA16725.1 C6 transcription factor [Rasamsonia emersonii CBS 393.64]